MSEVRHDRDDPNRHLRLSHEHWRGRFYGPSARGAELERYAEQFDTVELNVTFYRMPAAQTFRAWAARVPPGFLFA